MTSFSRVMRILIGGMIVGIVIFGIVVIFLPVSLQEPGEEESGFPLLITICIAYSPTSFFLAPILASLVTTIVRKAIASGKTLSSVRMNAPHISQEFLITPLGLLCKAYMSRTIVLAAVVESGALFCIVVYMLEGNPLSLACAALAVMYILLVFPSVDRMERWIEPQQRMLDAEKQTPQVH